MVSYRIKLHEFPDKVKEFISQKLITEAQLTEILPLSVDLYFSLWLTTDQIREGQKAVLANEYRKVISEKALKERAERAINTRWDNKEYLSETLADKNETDTRKLAAEHMHVSEWKAITGSPS